MQSFSHFVLRRAGLVALVGTLLAFVGAYYSVQLYKNLRTDIEELLPTSARSVIDLNEVAQRLESIDNLAVLMLSKDAQAAKRFQIDLATRLETIPKNVIASVEYRIDKELKFFREREALYMDLPDLIRIRNYIEGRIEYEKELYNPLNIFRGEEIPEPKLDFLALRQKYEVRASGYGHLPDGYYATPDGTIRAILAYMPGKQSSIDQVHRLKEAVEEAVSSLNPRTYAPDLEIRYSGGVQDTLEEHSALIADLELSTVIVVIVVTLAMWAFYRNARVTFALIASLFMGTFWTFGISYFVVGYLNANSAFLGSIVIGNGINFGIIFLARYAEERRTQRANTRAIRISMGYTATSTWTAALAAGLSYGSLMLTGFRGFNQFGVIGLIGMMLCWLSAFTLLPAYLTLIDRVWPLVRLQKKIPKQRITAGVAKLVDRYPRPLWALSFLVTIASLATFVRYSPGILETNLLNLRNKESIERGSAYNSKYLDQIFQRFLSPVVALPRDVKDAPKIAAALRSVKERKGKRSLIANVQTLDDFIPKDQLKKIEVLRQIRKILPPRLVQRLSVEDQKLVGQFLSKAARAPVVKEDLPPLILQKFTEKDKTVGKMVLVEPPLDNSLAMGENLMTFAREIRETADSVAPGTPVAGSLMITADMLAAISSDGPKATFFAFLAVVLLVVFLFREVKTITLILFSLILGILWLAGIILGFGLKINFLNFIALPITFGIGVDYGVNIFQRYRLEKNGNILTVIRNTGGAVGLCSFTTIVGYASLLIASNQGFVSFGRLAVLGELTCLIAAVISLPAYLHLKSRKRGLV